MDTIGCIQIQDGKYTILLGENAGTFFEVEGIRKKRVQMVRKN